jgi:uncharacterized lipoprotein YmbA
VKTLSMSLSLCLIILLGACVAHQADHFYILNAQPQSASPPRSAPLTQATIRMALPSLVDRPEMVVNTSAEGIAVLEHERWAAPLADLMTQTLARNIEQRRSDMLVASRGGDARIKIIIDVVQMTVRRGQQASIEAHWRIIGARAGTDAVGADIFVAPLREQDYAAVAQALSQCLGLLADRLVEQL